MKRRSLRAHVFVDSAEPAIVFACAFRLEEDHVVLEGMTPCVDHPPAMLERIGVCLRLSWGLHRVLAPHKSATEKCWLWGLMRSETPEALFERALSAREQRVFWKGCVVETKTPVRRRPGHVSLCHA